MKKLLPFILFVFIAGCSGEVTSLSDSEDNPSVVDVDLTKLSSTVAMAEVNRIIENSDDYIGKTIRISGPYVASYYNETGKYYHYVLIDSCCMGFEFILNGDYSYPEDYPENMEIIEIIGVFGSYAELGQKYFYLAVDDIGLQ